MKDADPKLKDEDLKKEVKMLIDITSSNVVRLSSYYSTPDNFYIFMRYCNGGDLNKLLRIKGSFSELEAKYFLR